MLVDYNSLKVSLGEGVKYTSCFYPYPHKKTNWVDELERSFS